MRSTPLLAILRMIGHDRPRPHSTRTPGTECVGGTPPPITRRPRSDSHRERCPPREAMTNATIEWPIRRKDSVVPPDPPKGLPVAVFQSRILPGRPTGRLIPSVEKANVWEASLRSFEETQLSVSVPDASRPGIFESS